jgi:hypothetical protein
MWRLRHYSSSRGRFTFAIDRRSAVNRRRRNPKTTTDSCRHRQPADINGLLEGRRRAVATAALGRSQPVKEQRTTYTITTTHQPAKPNVTGSFTANFFRSSFTFRHPTLPPPATSPPINHNRFFFIANGRPSPRGWCDALPSTLPREHGNPTTEPGLLSSIPAEEPDREEHGAEGPGA